MPIDIGIWRIDNDPQQVDFSPLDFEHRLQGILDQDITIADPNWMVIGREVRTSSGKELDLLAMDADGNLVVIELKRDKTPRDIVAQVLDYGSWVVSLRTEDIAGIFSSYVSKYYEELGIISLDDAFSKRFGPGVIPDELNSSHQLVIVASSVDPATERIVKYLTEHWGVNVNVAFFLVFKDGDHEYLTRAWLSEPALEQGDLESPTPRGAWNEEYYVSFGESEHRNWEDARKYGFISAGGGPKWTSPLNMLQPGDRVWVNIIGKGYAGVGEVTSAAVHFEQFKVLDGDGQRPITDFQGQIKATDAFDREHGEHFVGVRWLKTIPAGGAIREKGFFGNQNIVARPKDPKWNHTVERLKKRLGITV
jgi:hypothetical protein